MDAVNKSHNVSAIMRTADAVGIHRLHAHLDRRRAAPPSHDRGRREALGRSSRCTPRPPPRSPRCAPRAGGSSRRTPGPKRARLSRRRLHGQGRDHGRRRARRLERRGARGRRRPSRDSDARARHVAERLGRGRRRSCSKRSGSAARPGSTTTRGSHPPSASVRCSSGVIPRSRERCRELGREYPQLTADGMMASNPLLDVRRVARRRLLAAAEGRGGVVARARAAGGGSP